MPNPYDDIFADDSAKKPEPPAKQAAFSIDPLNDPRFQDDGPDDLDAILEKVREFNVQAEMFSKLLSRLRVVDHQVKNKVAKLFFVTEDIHRRGSLAGEKQLHELQTQKFLAIIEPMRELALLHLDCVKRYNADIDENYFNADKSDAKVEAEKAQVMDAINLQRKILADGAEDLKILHDGLVDTERRIKGYVNVGGENNISSSELELMARKREAMTSGREHCFDYPIFDVNLLDKTAISLGIYLKETSTQYLDKLGKALQT